MISFSRKQPSFFERMTSAFIAFSFIFTSMLPANVSAQTLSNILNMPAPGVMIAQSPGYMPTIIKGISVNPENPLNFTFYVSKGDNSPSEVELRKESDKLIKYFLATLTTPSQDLWVNLSPYEKDQMITDKFGVTEMGRDLLAQDYVLKQLTASLMYPENELGQKFWDRVHQKAYEKFGTTDIPVDTFNKIWIIPERAAIYEHDGSAFVVNSKLKVMLAQDYLALQKSIDRKEHGLSQVGEQLATEKSGLISDIIREVLVPEIEKEVNEGETFANLRQVFHSMILATWFKNNLKETLLGQVYVNQNKISGVDVDDPAVKEKIYDQYLKAFNLGVYNYIKEEYDPATQKMMPRQYFSGGFGFKAIDAAVTAETYDQDTLRYASRDVIRGAMSISEDTDLAMLDVDLYEAQGANEIVIAQAVEASLLDTIEIAEAGTAAQKVLTDAAMLVSDVQARLSALLPSQGEIDNLRKSGADSVAETLTRRRNALNIVLKTESQVQPTLVKVISELDPVKDLELRKQVVSIWVDYVDARSKDGKATADIALNRDRQMEALKDIPMEGADISDLPTVQAYVAQEAFLLQPEKIIVVDASDQEQMTALQEKALEDQVLIEGPNGKYGSYSHPDDTARAVGPTKNVSRNASDKGPSNNHHSSRDTLIDHLARTIGQHQGKTMYVVSTMSGNQDSPAGTAVIQVSDNLGIIMQYNKLYNLGGDLLGQATLDRIKEDDGEFLKISHATGDLDNVRRENDAVIEHVDGSFRKLNKSEEFVVLDAEDNFVLANVRNDQGKMELRDAREEELAALEARFSEVQQIQLSKFESARRIRDYEDDRSFVLFMDEPDGSGDFIDQFGSNEVRLINSAYGGNGIGSKKFVLRLSVLKAIRSKSMSIAHAYQAIFRDKETGETFGIIGRFPSMVGKSNAALGEVVEYLAEQMETLFMTDDIVLIDSVAYDENGERIPESQLTGDYKFDEEIGENAEGGAFLVAPGMNSNELRGGIVSIEDGGGLSVNLGYRLYVDADTGRLKFSDEYWKSHDKPVAELVEEILAEYFQNERGELPALTGWHDWKQIPLHTRLNGLLPSQFNENDAKVLVNDIKTYSSTSKADRDSLQLQSGVDLVKQVIDQFTAKGKEIAQANSRYSITVDQVPNWYGHETAKEGTRPRHRIDIDETGGRRPDTQPLTRMIVGKISGLYWQVFNRSQGTAATEGAEGKMMPEPDAMWQFFPTRAGAYLDHRIDRTLRLKDGAKFNVGINPFLRHRDGKGGFTDEFIYPGFRDNSRFRIWNIKLLKQLRQFIADNPTLDLLNVEDANVIQFLRDNLDSTEYQVHDLGYILPTKDSSVFEGLDLSEEARERLTTIYPEEYKAEIQAITEFIMAKGKAGLDMDVPDELRREHERLAKYFGVELPAAWYQAKPWAEMEAERVAQLDSVSQDGVEDQALLADSDPSKLAGELQFIDQKLRALKELGVEFSLEYGSRSSLLERRKQISQLLELTVDEAMTAGEYKPVNVPANFSITLGDQHGLKTQKVRVKLLKGNADVDDLLQDPQARYIIESSSAAALGAYYLRGIGKKTPGGLDIKAAGDANALQFVEDENIRFIKENAGFAIVELASEGARDGSISSPVGRIYHNSFEDNKVDTVKFAWDEEGRAFIKSFDKDLYIRTLDALRAQGVVILFKITDPLEKTEGLVVEEALNNPTDSWALNSVVVDKGQGPYRLPIDDNFRTAGYSYNAPNKANIGALDKPSRAIPRIAEANGIQLWVDSSLPKNKRQITPEYKEWLENVQLVLLGPRGLELKDIDSSDSRHAEYIADALAFIEDMNHRFGVSIFHEASGTKGIHLAPVTDGDLMPRMMSLAGPMELNDGRYIITLGRSGSAEAEAARAFAKTVDNARMVSRRVSTKGTANNVSYDTASKYTETRDAYNPLQASEREMNKILGYSGRVLSTEFNDEDEDVETFVAMTTVTGASNHLGENFAREMKSVQHNAADGTVTTTTLVSDQNGVLYSVETVYTSDQLVDSVASILSNSPLSQAIVDELPSLLEALEADQATLSDDLAEDADVSRTAEVLPADDKGPIISEFPVDEDGDLVSRAPVQDTVIATDVSDRVRVIPGVEEGPVISEFNVDENGDLIPRDQAMTAPKKKGGIDLNPELLDLQIKRDGSGIPLPINLQPLNIFEDIKGFIPVIIDVTPVFNMPMILGLADDYDDHSEYGYDYEHQSEQPKARLKDEEEYDQLSFLN